MIMLLLTAIKVISPNNYFLKKKPYFWSTIDTEYFQEGWDTQFIFNVLCVFLEKMTFPITKQTYLSKC